MKIMRRRAKYRSIITYNGQKVQEYECPNEKCRQVIYGGYKICPYCGQRLEIVTPNQLIKHVISLLHAEIERQSKRGINLSKEEW